MWYEKTSTATNDTLGTGVEPLKLRDVSIIS
jgi:hypothetical protein